MIQLLIDTLHEVENIAIFGKSYLTDFQASKNKIIRSIF